MCFQKPGRNLENLKEIWKSGKNLEKTSGNPVNSFGITVAELVLKLFDI